MLQKDSLNISLTVKRQKAELFYLVSVTKFTVHGEFTNILQYKTGVNTNLNTGLQDFT